MKIALTILILSITGATASADTTASARELCQQLLTLTPEGHSTLAPSAVREMATAFGRGSRTGENQFADSLRVIVDSLVSENAITADQAETVFATRLLGQYAPIFLRFAVAELRARDFSSDRIVDFVIHFENAYGAEEQIDFAVAVARRMLVTVNDAASWSSPEGLEQFLAMVATFGVTSDIYARFLETWTYVRSAHPQTVVHFILANVRNAGERVTAEASERIEASREIVAESRPAMKWLNSFLGIEPSARVPATLKQSAVSVLRNLQVPDFIQNVEGLIIDPTPPDSRFERFFAISAEGGDAQFADRLALVPPAARDFLVLNRVTHLGYRQLFHLMRSPTFPKLAPESQAKVREEMAHFQPMAKMALEIQRRAVAERAVDQGSRRPEVINSILESFQFAFKSGGTTLSGSKISMFVLAAFSDGQREHGILNGREFLSAARQILTVVFTTRQGKLALGALSSLAALSKDYVLDPVEVEDLVRYVGSVELKEPGYDGHRILRRFDSAPDALSNSAWGDRTGARDRGREPNDQSELAADLIAFRGLLPSEESADPTDRELIEKLEAYAPIKPNRKGEQR